MQKIFGVAALVLALSTVGKIPYYNSHKIVQVSGAALKMNGEDIEAEFQIFLPDSDGYWGSETEMITTVAPTLEKCVESAAKIYGKDLFLKDLQVLILSSNDLERLIPLLESFYGKAENSRMNQLVMLWKPALNQAFFTSKVNSLDIKNSAEILKYSYTLQDLLNGTSIPVFVKREDGYEIIKGG